MALDIGKIIQYPLNIGQYTSMDTSSKKCQIYLHHTAGGPNPYGVVDYWNYNSEKVATPFIIAGYHVKNKAGQLWKDGDIIQCFSSKNYAYHLNVSSKGNKAPSQYKTSANDQDLAERSIGIELCNYGYITRKGDQYFSYTGSQVSENNIITYNNRFKGNLYYERYTLGQISSLRELLIYLCDRYNIPRIYNDDIWGITERALKGEPGIYTHNSVRSDKSDVHPQPDLIEMLKTL